MGHVCNYVTHTCPLIHQRFQIGVPVSCPRFGDSFEGVSEPVLGDGSQGLGPFGVLGFDASCPGFVSELQGVFLFHAGFEFGEG